MSSDKVRSSKLKFKGDKTKKKRKRDDGDDAAPSTRKRREEDDLPDEAWVLPEDANEIRGPTFVFHPSDPSPICVTYDATRARIAMISLDKDLKAEDAAEAPTPQTRTPSEVSQVWVTTRVAGSPTVNLRTGTGEGKFMSCDKHGIVTADSDARGPQEEWTPVVLPEGMVAFMNVYEKYLSVDEVAGGQLQLRADSEEVGFGERFWVKIQNKYKKQAHEETKKKKMEGLSLEPSVDEDTTNRIYQSWGAGRHVTSGLGSSDLKKARNEGRLAEALLDRRAKLKSDRFC